MLTTMLERRKELLNNCVRNNNPANIYLFKVNNINSRKRCERCSKLTIKTPKEVSASINYLEQINVSWESYLVY